MLFAVLVVVGVGVVHWYVWVRVVRDTSTGRRVRRAGAWVVAALGVLAAVTAVGNRALPRRYEPVLERIVGWPGYVWLAVLAYLVLALVVLELPRWAARVVLLSRPVEHSAAPAGAAPSSTAPGGTAPGGAITAADGGVDRQRRLLIARGAAIMAGLAATGVTAAGMASALGPPATRRVRVPLAKLPRGMDGTRIALVSDVHLGALLGRAHTERVVAAVNALDADIVAVVGDLVDGTVGDLGTAAEPLRGLRSRRGAYFVTGNHEYFSGHEDWIGHVGGLGLRVLRNARVEVDGLDLAGVNDATGGSVGDPPDYDLALGGRDPGRPVVLLAHQPVQAHEAAKRGVDLQLSGHTHGGQLWPFHYVTRASQPVTTGLGQVDGMPVYVTNGAGFWGPPVRVGAAPDVTLVELRAP
ncbi:metallophosphoesterase [Dactylosporangium aurantiacum]|uniref:Metallophosphoesterase n=1 Tax=Dactylosporangium aurantiacum TaxID=35754 RepID=A0A9Q9ILT6_9ACTN|nr:metallophosphoesterase [Dactylosporangium aurantiacum]MDG6108576.1 metallophosphoesterase [Dactylosporangium aurantiacum]UWZ57243.1 metallophosphoesterase [Dactylosporangium aurantiacum]